MENKKRVLIIEDDLALVKMLVNWLEEEGYEVRTGVGETSLQLAREFQPDVVLLDIMMPQMNGLEWSRLAQSDDRLKDVPIIVLSAAETGLLKRQYQDLKASTFLSKPFDIESLLILVDTLSYQSFHA